MKFILNTAVDPHFCALFDESGVRGFYREWENRRRDGIELWEFLKQYDVSKFTFLGGISGPGGFSSLRAGAGVLNSLAFTTGLLVHSLRADFLQKALLKGEKTEVLLNSFGDGIWIQNKTELIRKTVEEASKDFSNNLVCVSWLPEEKQKLFQNPFLLNTGKAPEVLLSLLEKEKGHPQFITNYEVPPV